MPRLKETTPHSAALRGYLKSIPKLLLMLIVQLAVRFIALLPLVYALNGGILPFVKEKFSAAVCVLLCLPLYALLVLPARIWGASVLCSCISDSRRRLNITWKHYTRWLRLGLRRVWMTLPFAALFVGTIAFLYAWFNIIPFNTGWIMIGDIGKVFGGTYVAGLLVILFVFLLSILLLAYGWWRTLSIDYQPVVELGCRRAVERAVDARQQAGKRFRNITFINTLILLPAILGFIIILILFFQENIMSMMTGNLQFMLQFVAQYLKRTLFVTGLPAKTITLLLICELVLHLPFLLWRKLSYAVIVQDVCRKRDGYRFINNKR